jgi:gluconate 2-dehydrogenase subunit 3-like protein
MRSENAEFGMRIGEDEVEDEVDTEEEQPPNLSRREIMKLMSVAVVAVPGTDNKQVTRRGRRKVYRFFTRAEFAMVDELSEMIIPTDDHSPGARAAKVAAYIDKTLGETLEVETKQRWRAGLKSINSLARETHGIPFMRTAPDQRLAILERIAQNETNPQRPEDKFFVELKSRVAHAYYTSKIGLRQELEYKGNTYLREFAGEEVKGRAGERESGRGGE